MLDVVIADDDADYRLLARLAMDGEADIVVRDEAATADQLIDIVTASPPDLVLLDASLPSCLAASARLRLNAPKTRIVLTSSLPARRSFAGLACSAV
jgi:DNA-binding NarL/FixJ family response regulator